MTNDDNDDHDKRKQVTYQMYKSYNMQLWVKGKSILY